MRPFVKEGNDSSISANATDNVIDYTVTSADGNVTITHVGINPGDAGVDKVTIDIGDGRIKHEWRQLGSTGNIYPFGLLSATPRRPLPVPLVAHVGEHIKAQVTATDAGVSTRTDIFLIGTKEAPGAKDRGPGSKTKPWFDSGIVNAGTANAYKDLVSHTVTAETGAITIGTIGINGTTNLNGLRLLVGDETLIEVAVNGATSCIFPIPEDDDSIMQDLPIEVRADVGEAIKLQGKSAGTAFTSGCYGAIIGWQELE